MARTPVTRTTRTAAGSGGNAGPQPRRRARMTLASIPMRYLSKLVEDQNAQALNAAPVDMLNEDEQAAYRAVQEFFGRYRHFPTVNTMLERGVRLPEAPEPLEFYRDEMNNQIRIRNAATLIHDIQPLLDQRDGRAVQDAIQQFQDTVMDPSTGVILYGEARAALLERFTPAGTAGAVRPTGLNAVDVSLGGVRSGGLWAVAGRPGAGKTYIQVAAGVNLIMQRERVLWVTKELSVEEMQDRVLALSTGLNPGLGTNRMASTFTQRVVEERIVNALQGRDNDLAFVEDAQTPADVEAAMREFNPTQVLIDGTYFLKPVDFNSRDSRTERYEKLIRELQQLGKRTRRTIGLTWQQNRGKAYGTEGLYGSDALSQDASLVLMIKKYKQDDEVRGLHVSKNRHGPEGMDIGVTFKFRPTDIGTLTDLPQTRGQRNTDRGRQDHTDRAVQQAMGGRAPGAETVE